MALSYPLTLPTARGLRGVTFTDRQAIGVSESPFSLSQQVYEHQGDAWAATLEFTEMARADAEEWIAWRLGLAGMLGTFLMGDPVSTAPRGTWVSPVVSGAHAAGVKTLQIRGVDGLTWKRGDWFQLGSGSSPYLHKVVQDGQQAGSPSVGEVEFWPRTRAALSDGAAIDLTSPLGKWRLASNASRWTLSPENGFILAPLDVVEAR